TMMNQSKDRLLEESRYLNLKRSLEKLLQPTLAKAINKLKQTFYLGSNHDEELDEAIKSKSLEPIQKACDLAYTRAYTLRVANKESWDVASALNDTESNNPMEAILKEKLLNKAYNLFNEFCHWAKVSNDQVDIDILITFIGWLDMTGQVAKLQICLNALLKEFKYLGKIDITNNWRIKATVRSLKLLKA
ncbi:11509_t:CDS:2, partial [Racocetra fulgida]